MSGWADDFKDTINENELETVNDSGDQRTIKTRISDMRKKLNIWQGFKFDIATDKEIAKVAGELVVNQLNAEKEIAIDKIINNVALEKRQNLKQYLESVAITDKDILNSGEETKKDLSYTMQTEITQIVKDKKLWKDESKKLLDNDEIEEEDYKSLLLMHEKEALELIQSKRDDRNTVRETYKKRLGQALQSYVERNPDYSGL